MRSRIQIFLSALVIFPAALLMGGQWQAGAPMNTPRQGAAVVVMGDYIYVMGGKSLNNSILNTVERFNLSTQQWEQVASFNTPRMGAAAIVLRDSIFLTGGRANLFDDAMKEVEVYDAVQNLWHSAQDMRREREGHTLAYFNNRIYAIGGQKNGSSYEEEIEWYDETGDDWKEAAFEIAYRRAAFFSGVIGDTFYMCGGFYYGPTQNSAIKPPSTLNWYDGPNMAEARAGGADAVLGDSLFMIGGETFSGITDVVEIYDPHSWQIIPGPSLPEARKGMTAATLNNKIYVIGGVTAQSGGQPTNSVVVYSTGPVGIPEPPNQLIETVHLVGYPNPFNGSINLQFQMPQRSKAQLTIFDLQGRRIKTLLNENLTEGAHEVSWAGEDSENRQVSSGIYFAILKGERFHQAFKIFYIK